MNKNYYKALQIRKNREASGSNYLREQFEERQKRQNHKLDFQKLVEMAHIKC